MRTFLPRASSDRPGLRTGRRGEVPETNNALRMRVASNEVRLREWMGGQGGAPANGIVYRMVFRMAWKKRAWMDR